MFYDTEVNRFEMFSVNPHVFINYSGFLFVLTIWLSHSVHTRTLLTQRAVHLCPAKGCSVKYEHPDTYSGSCQNNKYRSKFSPHGPVIHQFIFK